VYQCSEQLSGGPRWPARAPLRNNGAMPNRRPELQLIAPNASPEEAAAIVAALERFMRVTGHGSPPPEPPGDPWRRAAILEGVGRAGQGDLRDPWINT
jgi:hypothetical protein